jgi:hypothetical protein
MVRGPSYEEVQSLFVGLKPAGKAERALSRTTVAHYGVRSLSLVDLSGLFQQALHQREVKNHLLEILLVAISRFVGITS